MNSFKDRAKELLAARMAALDALEAAQARIATATVELHEAQRGIGTAWTRATDAGWTPRELRKLGVTQPTTRRGGRPRKTATTAGTAPHTKTDLGTTPTDVSGVTDTE